MFTLIDFLWPSVTQILIEIINYCIVLIVFFIMIFKIINIYRWFYTTEIYEKTFLLES